MKSRIPFCAFLGLLTGFLCGCRLSGETVRLSAKDPKPGDRVLERVAVFAFLERHRDWFSDSGEGWTAFLGCGKETFAAARKSYPDVLLGQPKRVRRSGEHPDLFVDPATGRSGKALKVEVLPRDPEAPGGMRTVAVEDAGRSGVWICQLVERDGQWTVSERPAWAE